MHAYPDDLARFVIVNWPPRAALPSTEALTRLFSIAYQASLLRDEERPVSFRLVLGEPDDFPRESGPPVGLHRLVFEHARPYDEYELRRLSSAVRYHRALIGVHPIGHERFAIWGMLQSGPRWLQADTGGRAKVTEMNSDSLVVRVSGPGRLVVVCGDTAIAEMRRGTIATPSMDVFRSRWLGERFISARNELAVLHEAMRGDSATWAEIDPTLSGQITQQVLKRTIAAIRATHHGGTVIFVPHEQLDPSRHLAIKYCFADDEPRRRYRTLILKLMKNLARSDNPEGGAIGWTSYAAIQHPSFHQLDEAMFELAYLFASLAGTDGAVVLSTRFELLGFGAEITGDLPDVSRVRKSVDLEGKRAVYETLDGVGTRHRSVYRYCAAVHGAVGIVVSQDDNVRFVAADSHGEVTVWDHDTVSTPVA